MPGEISCSSSMARARPRTVLAGSCAFSKRMEASVRSLMAEDVLRMEDAWKLALSSTTRRGGLADGAVHAADHAGQGDGAAGIGDHQVGGVERVMLAVQGAELLAGPGGADEDGVAPQQVGVEGVHGLGQLGHDEVGHVDDVVDGVQADGGQAALQPLRATGATVTFSKTSALYRGQRSRSSIWTRMAGAAGGEQVERHGILQACSRRWRRLPAPCRDGPTDRGGG